MCYVIKEIRVVCLHRHDVLDGTDDDTRADLESVKSVGVLDGGEAAEEVLGQVLDLLLRRHVQEAAP